MVEIIARRVVAEMEGEFVVFLIGMRINKPLKIWSWAPVTQAMPRMLGELFAKPELGLLSARSHFGFLVQYWRSLEQLHAYAHARNSEHLPAWRSFNQAVGSNGDGGIWHETYLVKPDHYEAIYNNMPRYGLGLAGGIFDAKDERASAAKRLRRADLGD